MNKGQNITEFVLILSVVIIAAILTLMFFGKNVHQMFSKSHGNYKPYTPFDYKNSNTAHTPTIPVSNTYADVFSTTAPDNMVSNPDGSFTLNYGDQNYSVSSDIVALMDVVMSSSTIVESIGAEGNTEFLANMINYMISQHINEYPDGVPLEISMGDTDRMYADTSAEGTYSLVNQVSGSAEVNMATIRVGNHVLLFQHDQTCEIGTAHCGNYFLEGKISPSNVLNASIKSLEDPDLDQKFATLIVEDKEDSLYIYGSSSDLSLWYKPPESEDSIPIDSVDWKMTFNDPAKQFSISAD